MSFSWDPSNYIWSTEAKIHGTAISHHGNLPDMFIKIGIWDMHREPSNPDRVVADIDVALLAQQWPNPTGHFGFTIQLGAAITTSVDTSYHLLSDSDNPVSEITSTECTDPVHNPWFKPYDDDVWPDYKYYRDHYLLSSRSSEYISNAAVLNFYFACGCTACFYDAERVEPDITYTEFTNRFYPVANYVLGPEVIPSVDDPYIWRYDSGQSKWVLDRRAFMQLSHAWNELRGR